MATINLGNIVGNRVLGLSSGIDTENLIKELAQVRQRPIDILNNKISANSTKAAQYGTLNTLLNNLKSSANYLRNPTGINANYSNIFSYRKASLSATGGISASSYLNVVANPGANIGSSSIQIGQIAKSLELRSASFNSRSIDATTATTGSYFTAGTFQIGSGIVTSAAGSSLTGYQLSSQDYRVHGSATGTVITAAGIHNVAVTGSEGGLQSLKGSATGVGGSNINTGQVVFNINIGGVSYSSGAVQVDQSVNGGLSTGIEAGTVLTFTAGAGGDHETSFDIQIGASDIIIDDDQANVDAFVADIAASLGSQSIYQSRQLSNFNDSAVSGPLTGLTSANVKYSSATYGNTGGIGTIGGFSVEYGAGSTSAVSVTIGGETFRATALGDNLNAPLVLQSTTSDKTLTIDLTGLGVDLANADDAVALERSLDYAFGARKMVNITVNAGDSLNDVLYNINQLAGQTGVTASIIKINDFDYKFSLKALNEGIDNSFEIFDTGGVLANTGVTDPGNVVQQAQDSLLRINGVEIRRSTNTVTDAVENVTLNLLAVTPDYNQPDPATVNLSVQNDVDTVMDRVVAFLDAFNALRVFATEQNLRDPVTGRYVENAVLGGDSTLQAMSNSLLTEINRVVGNVSDTAFDALSDLGITMQDYQGDASTPATANILVFDEAVLRNALEQNFDKMREVFEFKFTSSSSNLALYKSSNSFTLSDFRLDIDLNGPAGQKVKLLNANGTDYLDGNGNAVYLDYTGGRISGKAGTAVAGLEFLYTGGSTSNISVSLSQGISDRIFNLSDSYVAAGGVLSNAVEDLSDQNSTHRTDILGLENRLEQYINRLRAQFTSLEQALASVNNILMLLDANSQAYNNRN